MSATLPIPPNDRTITLTATAGQTVFPFDYPVQLETDLMVEAALAASPTVFVPLDFASGAYRVTGAGQASGGAVVVTVARAAGDKIRITGDADVSRVTSVARAGKFSSAAVDADLDRATILMQEARRDIDRALAGVGEPFSPLVTLSDIIGLTGWGAALAGGPYLTSQIDAAVIPAPVTRFVTFGWDAPDPRSAAWWKSISTPGSVKAWHRQSADGRWWQMFNRDVYPQAFGARGDSTGTPGSGTNDTSAIDAWRDYVLTFGGAGLLSGFYRYRPASDWDFAGHNAGLLFEGRNRNGDGFVLDAGYTLSLAVGNFFYMSMKRIRLVGNVAGPVLRLGKDDFSDALNGCDFDLVINNASLDDAAEGLRVNYACFCDFLVTSNLGGTGRPGQATTPGHGQAVRLRQACFSRFALACGQANVGLAITDGYNFANQFEALDLEEVAIGLKISSANASRNVFLSGQFVGSTVLDCTAGYANAVRSACNLAPYAGGSIGSNLVGIEIEKAAPRAFELTLAPSLPASGVYFTNASGSRAFVKIWAGVVSAISLKAIDGAETSWNPQNAGEQSDVIVPPGWSIAITYSSAPSWRWLPA